MQLTPPRGADRRAAHELADAGSGNQHAVVDDYVAAQQDSYGSSDHLLTLEDVVVHARMVVAGGDRQLPVGVEDDQVGVAARRDSPLLGKQPEQPRRRR